MIETLTKTTFSQQLLDLKKRFSRIADNDSNVSRENFAACACGGKILVKASKAGLLPFDLPAPPPVETLSDDDTLSWSVLWETSMFALSHYMPESFPSNPGAVTWQQVESTDADKIRIGSVKKQDWRIRIENFAFACDVLAELFADKLSRPMSKKEAAVFHNGVITSNPTAYFEKLIQNGRMKPPVGSGQRWRFCVSDFPESVRAKMV